ncbi:hypothetical protein [Methylorubrum extorquens]|uniref:DUF7940 domain-containing protein n=1 Tax=Methylorubrum extorquens TaxID=408 RepID=UPI00209D3369|nr:hypothetical protein [Methylorubrum extorquens]MCP1540047.1 hypothetical protein [Methylorubrum extorquens]
MKLHPDWKKILKRAWSIRIDALSVALAGLEVGFNTLAGKPPIDPVHFAVIGVVLTALSMWVRLVKQHELDGIPAKDEEAQS